MFSVECMGFPRTESLQSKEKSCNNETQSPEQSQKAASNVCHLQDRCVAALARVERTDFLYPMFIGEVAHVSAEITFTSKHSVEVQVSVVSENILSGQWVFSMIINVCHLHKQRVSAQILKALLKTYTCSQFIKLRQIRSQFNKESCKNGDYE